MACVISIQGITWAGNLSKRKNHTACNWLSCGCDIKHKVEMIPTAHDVIVIATCVLGNNTLMLPLHSYEVVCESSTKFTSYCFRQLRLAFASIELFSNRFRNTIVRVPTSYRYVFKCQKGSDTKLQLVYFDLLLSGIQITFVNMVSYSSCIRKVRNGFDSCS